MQVAKKTLGSIQLLRGIACILVVLLHITINCEEKTGGIFLFNIFKFGGSGVDIFFVLSGFIITYTNFTYIGKPFTGVKYLKRRFIRIFPIYWIIITCLILLQILLPDFYNTKFDTGIFNIIQTYLLLPGHVMLNGVSWSLTNELFFYLLYALAIVIPQKKISFYLLIIYFCILIVFAIIGPVNLLGSSSLTIFLFPMNIEFILGVFVVLIVNSILPKYVFPILIVGIVIFMFGAFLNDRNIDLSRSFSNQALNRVLLFGIPSFLIILALVKMELTKNIYLHSIFLKLGDASYSIYLLHLPIVAAFFKIMAKLRIENTAITQLFCLLLLILVCSIGVWIYHNIEKPIIRALNKLL